MGTSIHVLDAEFHMTDESLAAAAKELEYDDAAALLDALKENDWVLTVNNSGDVDGVDFASKKLHGDMNEILPALAPFVEPGSFIQLEGGALVRYDFDGKRCLLRNSDEVVDDPDEIEPAVLFGPELDTPADIDEDDYLGLDDDEESDELDF